MQNSAGLVDEGAVRLAAMDKIRLEARRGAAVSPEATAR
jgi:hypothetical protein